MNIFGLDYDPSEAAKMLCDKHIIKMPLETTQLFATFLNELNIVTKYKPTHKNHPCSIWLKLSHENRYWFICYAEELFKEFKFRRNKDHASKEIFKQMVDDYKLNFSNINKLQNSIIKNPQEYLIYYLQKNCIEYENYNNLTIKYGNSNKFYDFYPAMPDKYRDNNKLSKDMYIDYYLNDKKDIAEWNYIPSRGEWFEHERYKRIQKREIKI